MLFALVTKEMAPIVTEAAKPAILAPVLITTER